MFDGAKAKLNSDYCKPFLRKCSDVIEFLGNYGQRAGILFEKLEKFYIGRLQVNAKGTNIRNLATPLSKFMATLRSMHAFGLAINYSLKKDIIETNVKLCNSIVSIVHSPFLDVINKMCELATAYLSKWNEIAYYIGKNHIRDVNNWIHHPRLLQSEDLIPFEGDVKVVNVQAKIDSSYTSYLGANGTTNNENPFRTSAIPLNITAAFP
jgi:hypothetical protein